MSEQREVVILSGVRTAIGDYGGSLKDIAPSELAARVVKEAVTRAKVEPKDVGQCVIGNVIHTEPKDMYISRLACVNGGLPHDTGALTLNRLCGSGLQAIVSASQYILLGDNSPVSLDSRHWPNSGAVARSQIVGRVLRGRASR